MRIDKIMRVIDEHCQKDRLNDIQIGRAHV